MTSERSSPCSRPRNRLGRSLSAPLLSLKPGSRQKCGGGVYSWSTSVLDLSHDLHATWHSISSLLHVWVQSVGVLGKAFFFRLASHVNIIFVTPFTSFPNFFLFCRSFKDGFIAASSFERYWRAWVPIHLCHYLPSSQVWIAISTHCSLSAQNLQSGHNYAEAYTSSTSSHVTQTYTLGYCPKNGENGLMYTSWTIYWISCSVKT